MPSSRPATSPSSRARWSRSSRPATAASRPISRARARPSPSISSPRIRRGDMPRPDLWFTYHLYHKAPDWIGPAVAEALRHSLCRRRGLDRGQAQGRAPGRSAMTRALKAARSADLILAMTEHDEAGLQSRARAGRAGLSLHALHRAPSPGGQSVEKRGQGVARADLSGARSRHALAADGGDDARGDKEACYSALGRALRSRVRRSPGSGLAIHRLRRRTGARRYRGRISGTCPAKRIAMIGRGRPGLLDLCYLAADVFVWPGCGEAYGVAYLEAAAAGIPAVACARSRRSGRWCATAKPACSCRPARSDAYRRCHRELLAARRSVRARYGGFRAPREDRAHGFTTAVETLQAILPDRGDWLRRTQPDGGVMSRRGSILFYVQHLLGMRPCEARRDCLARASESDRLRT